MYLKQFAAMKVLNSYDSFMGIVWDKSKKEDLEQERFRSERKENNIKETG